MKWLNYHHLYYFWTVARLGTIAAACEELSLAQPTISAQLRTLERSIGHKLFRQVGRTLEMTEAGRIAYRYANDIFTLGREMGRHARGTPGREPRAAAHWRCRRAAEDDRRAYPAARHEG